ncbi:hypothetical protein DL95DRAFT_64267 [Leptodontidium sp. 2 PMI_412]|nr:hypothetical protein DL95DRAFT_64267 [Leptodontidium sp. 2 PMI_412]
MCFKLVTNISLPPLKNNHNITKSSSPLLSITQNSLLIHPSNPSNHPTATPANSPPLSYGIQCPAPFNSLTVDIVLGWSSHFSDALATSTGPAGSFSPTTMRKGWVKKVQYEKFGTRGVQSARVSF